MQSRLTHMAHALAAAGVLTFALCASAQQDTQPNPGTEQRAQAQPSSTQARLNTISEVQQALRERGYEAGQPDGKWGPRTQEALRQFQRSHGLQATGQIDPETAIALGLSADAGTAASGAAAAAAGAGSWLRVSQLDGMEVQNAQGEDMGRIEDVVIDLNNERVHYAVLSFGGTMGLGEKQFAYPMRTLAVGRTGDYLQLNVPRQRLEKAPGFDADSSPDWNADNNRYRQDVDRYFGDVVKIEQRPNMLLRRASDIVGKGIQDRDGNKIGEIEDLVVDVKDGRVHYAVVGFDQGWFSRDRLAAIPLRTMRAAPDVEDTLMLQLNQEQVAKAPGFNRGEWPDLNDRAFGSNVERWAAQLGLGEDRGTANRDADAGERSDTSGNR